MSSTITLNSFRGINNLIPFFLRNKYVVIGSLLTASLITIVLIAKRLFSYLKTQDERDPHSPPLSKEISQPASTIVAESVELQLIGANFEKDLNALNQPPIDSPADISFENFEQQLARNPTPIIKAIFTNLDWKQSNSPKIQTLTAKYTANVDQYLKKTLTKQARTSALNLKKIILATQSGFAEELEQFSMMASEIKRRVQKAVLNIGQMPCATTHDIYVNRDSTVLEVLSQIHVEVRDKFHQECGVLILNGTEIQFNINADSTVAKMNFFKIYDSKKTERTLQILFSS